MKQLILAGDVYQYRLYILKNNLQKEDAICVIGMGDLLGKSNGELAHMMKVGTWFKREYANIMPIRAHILSRGIDFELLPTGTI